MQRKAEALILLTECSSGTIQKLPFGVHTVIEPKNVTTTSDNTGTHQSCNIMCQMPFLWDVVYIFLSSIVVLTPNGQFLDRATIAFSERYNDINTEH